LPTMMIKLSCIFRLIFPMHLNFQQDMRYYTLISGTP
jgi:hypothetical protein